ncbi:huntingtin-interacting protein 1 isoform X1 [Patella vulgata]|uniref:huntingtin-interacting protein 1 isoform X1 n=1 Tax=Patella vulgata TaxID=6465 RepID=UPI0021803A04|nr:huntingtin-interacting protein 1 isoform X1 [Patella vulgata]
MSSLHLPRVVSQRGKSSLEVERENFERRQTNAIHKAINSQETPVKEKHVRNTILGSFQDGGASMFWTITGKLPLQGNPIVCWKFCHVLHKLMRDGHQHVVHDSMKYRSHLKDLGKLWGHLKEGYGKLIAAYCRFLIQRLNFHRKFPRIPGNLTMSDDQFNKICGTDVNNYFEFSIDMLDLLDEIIHLQQNVFGSLDMSRANSMTTAGQCRLAPLILAILDSCQLYDYLVKSLFRLHASLTPDTLAGHRERFLNGYKKLKQFYHSSSNLQYFKTLVQVPSLPEEPPNFLMASDFSKHVKPVAVVPQEADPEPEQDLDTPDDSLLDLSNPQQPDQFDQTFGQNNMGSFNFNGRPPEPDERDLLIDRLQKEIEQLKEELQRVKAEDQRVILSLKDEINKLEKILSELRLSADKALKENDSLKKEVEEARVAVIAAEKLGDAEKQSKANQEKFQKMKDIYSKLREEHVQLLRTHAEASKQLTADKTALEEKEQIIKESKLENERLEKERNAVQETLQKSADDVTQQLSIVEVAKSQLEIDKQELENKVQDLENCKVTLDSELHESHEAASTLTAQLLEAQQAMEQKEQQLGAQLADLQGQLALTLEEKNKNEGSLGGQLSDLQKKFDFTLAERLAAEDKLSQDIQSLQQRLEQTEKDGLETQAKLKENIDELHRKLLGSCVAEGKIIIKDALEQHDNPTHTTVTCTAEYLLLRAEPALSSLKKLKSSYDVYNTDKKELEELVSNINEFSHHLGDCIIHGFATSHSAQIEPGLQLASICKDVGVSGVELLDSVEKRSDVTSQIDKTVQQVNNLVKLAEDLLPKMEDVKAEEIGDLVDKEMSSTTAAIEAAAAKIEEMLKKTREVTTGTELEVNERILDACTALMIAIKELMEQSRDLQREIIAQGRGTSSAKDFYKKNHRWTEGLLSAAKTVGFGASSLMESADRVVKGEGKFEELIVFAQDIAASTAQLVVASKVKADKNSKTLGLLSNASKRVNNATGNVVASAKTGSQVIEDQGLMDFSKMTLYQTKKMEMEAQVKVLELENELKKERMRLGELRKQHYQLAGESEGWEVDQEIDESEGDHSAPLTLADLGVPDWAEPWDSDML